jgi:hypothetical protein
MAQISSGENVRKTCSRKTASMFVCKMLYFELKRLYVYLCVQFCLFVGGDKIIITLAKGFFLTRVTRFGEFGDYLLNTVS